MIWSLIFFAVLLAVYKYIWKPMSYWKDRGVVHSRPIPLLGNMASVILQRTSYYESILEIYNEFPKERYNGVLEITNPALLIRDLELIKRIGVKDFDHFMDHRDVGSHNHDILLDKNIFFMKEQKWKEMRTTLSPAFTASKMKAMFGLISGCAIQLSKYLEQQSLNNIEVDVKDMFARYTNDVIATCAFGVQCNSLEERENMFYMMGAAITDISGIRGIKLIIANYMPELFKLLRFKMFPKHLTEYFIDIIKETIYYRLNNGVIRPDIIHLLLEARKGKLKRVDTVEEADKGFSIIQESDVNKAKGYSTMELSDIDIAAQAFAFFVAGFDTSSTLLSFMATELAINTDVQERLYNEVRDVMMKYNHKPTYDAINDMRYLDMVVSEILRKWPPGFSTVRVCTKEYTIKAINPGEKDYTLDIGDRIIIPTLALHRNENYYPNPDKFDPERFSEENKSSIIPYTYLPFGIGPRACIGSRFALLEIKIIIVHLLTRFELKVTKRTCVPIKIAKSIKIQTENGFWLRLVARK